MGFELNGKIYETDENGYLKNPDDWDENVAEYIAKMVKIELTLDHWEVIKIARNYYQKYRYAPIVRIIVQEMKNIFEPKKATHKYFYNLFPEGPYNQTYKIAGVQMPFTCCGDENEPTIMRWYLWNKTYGTGVDCGVSDTPQDPPWLQKDSGEYWQMLMNL